MSKKAEYLVNTLSRTNKKDYENYVINAIWNRLGNDNIKPVTQQYVFSKEKNEGYLIDLFFPQLLVGIEIDERHHIFQKAEDYKRTDAIWHYFHKLDKDNNLNYIEMRIDVSEKTYEEIEKQINNVVAELKVLIKKINPPTWTIDAEKFLENQENLKVSDDVSFKTMAETCNTLFKTNYKDVRQSSFLPRKLKKHDFYSKRKLWFPQLAIEVEGELLSAAGKWNNRITPEGNIIEFHEEKAILVDKNHNEELMEQEERVVFAKSKAPLEKDKQYRFIGVYKRTRLIAIEHNGEYKGAYFYEMVSDKIPILK